MTAQFAIPAIRCAGCIGKIERGLSIIPGAQDIRVNLSLKRLSVTGQVDAEEVIASLQSLGFEAHILDFEALGQQQDKSGQNLLKRLAVSGFAMMNVMLLSVAIWSGATDATRDLFHLISALIAIPVVIYAGQPFFISAMSALRVKRLNMDVPISLAIILATGMSLFETLNSGKHAYFDAALSLTFFLLIGRYLDHRMRVTAQSAAKELSALEVHTAQIIEGTNVRSIPVSELEVGDVILVPSGSRIPVDGAVRSNNALLDRSLLTGESDPVPICSGGVAHAGSINLAAPFEMAVQTTSDSSSLRQISQLVETAENGRNRYTSLADKAAQVYAPLVHLLALFAFLGWVLTTQDIRHALNVAIAVLIITCPCALGLAVPAVSTTAISRLYKMGFLVKHATALDRLAEVDYVVFDKTGTITQPSVSLPPHLSDEHKSVALALAQISKHPLSCAVVDACASVPPATVEQAEEVKGNGISATWNGTQVCLGRGGWIGADFDELGLCIGDTPAYKITTSQNLRAGVQSAISDLNLPSEILTGDTDEKAREVADQLGLPFFANSSPKDKLDRLSKLKENHRNVFMVGDGLNDTVALAAAHASLSPASALDAARSASDVVLLKDNFDELPTLLRVARFYHRLSKQNFAIAAAYNCIAIPIALAGLATPLMAALAMSISSITVLLNAQRMRYI